MRRVVFFSHSQALGGAELSLLEIIARLDRSRFEPALLAPGDGPLTSRTRSLGVKILDAHIAPRLLSWQRGRFPRGFPAAELVNSAAGLATVLGLDKPTVIYTHSQKAHLLGGLAGRLAGVPVVWHAREVLGGPALRLLMSAMSRACPRRIICVSKAVAEQFPRVPGKVSVVPNGVDASEVRRLASLSAGKSTRSRLGLQASAPLLGMVSRIAPGKGQHVFIEAASLVSKRYPGTGFIIIGGTLFGEEPYLQELRRRAGSLGLGGMIHFTGHLENPLPAMRELDVLVHCPVVPEGFGRSVAEAMALGVPVVSVRGGGIPELIDDGVKGLLAEPGDARGLATAIGRLLSDRALAGRLALAAREKIETRFTMEAAMAAIERTLLEV